MVEISKSGSGEGLGRVIARGYSTSLPCASRHLHVPVQWPLRIEKKSLNSNKLSEIDCFTVCFGSRSFGAGTHHHPKAW